MKVIKDLRKHYSNGISIKVGGELEFLAGSPGRGSMNNTWRAGVLGELVLSPSIGLETGLKYSPRKLNFNRNQIDAIVFPGIDESLGEFEQAEVKSKTLEIPINLKYYYPVGENKQVYLAAGISPILLLSQDFKYDYSQSSEDGDGSAA